MQPVRILIADDHEVVRRGVRSLLKSRADWEVCGEAVDGRDAVQKAKELKPDVIVMDIGMPHLNGLEAARVIRKEVPQSEILILSQYEATEMRPAALQAGAREYITKSDVARDLLTAVESVTQHLTASGSTPIQRSAPLRSPRRSELKRRTPGSPLWWNPPMTPSSRRIWTESSPVGMRARSACS